MSPKISTNASLQLRILYGLPLAISLFAIVYSFSSGKLLVAVLAIVVAVAIIFAEIFFERRLSRVDEAKREANTIAGMLIGSGLMSLTVGLLIVLRK
ncbi:unannotated protein [freshwater metagenome]|jgi:hypothetical protein|uniref:Unannotated protein n=1 Tax=freshwater metagenome TaxID=449393 RepID=A0A6J7VLB8_9ZZZZ|nr:hypothetical protein [Actinomycetota bacterium]MSY51477.1 hypothetical protein [Actinomycetota bacterium]MSY87706.1 hypothetical protein [Actinomycetota bacterium]MTA51435.1 hypothetical protein [Actinomycetota bacterium]